MRAALLVFLLIGRAAAEPAPAKPEPLPPLAQLELHLGWGLAMSGSGDVMARRATPLTLTALVDYALQDADPPLWGYGGLVAEMMSRAAVGGVFGVKYVPAGTALHFAGGGSVLVAPHWLAGASVNGGYCRPQWMKTLGICGDLQVTGYFAGEDLGAERAVVQVQLVLGAVMDVL